MIQIKGAGISGSYLAYLFSRDGYDVIVYEMRKKGTNKPCGGGMVRRVFNELSFLKLDGIRIDGVIVDINGKITVYRERGIGFSVWREELESGLRELAESEGAVIRYGTAIRKLKNSGMNVDASGSKNSDIFGIEISSSKVNIEISNEFYFRIYRIKPPVRYGWVFPKIGGYSVGLAGDIDWILGNIDTFLSRIGATGRKRIAPIPVYRGEKNLFSDGVWRIGDSANLVDPLNYEGYTGAIFSARFLSSGGDFRPLFRYLNGELKIYRTVSRIPVIPVSSRFIKLWLRRVYSPSL